MLICIVVSRYIVIFIIGMGDELKTCTWVNKETLFL